MIEAIISACSSIIVGGLALLGVILTNNHANNKMMNEMKLNQAVTDEKINELTREVRLQNQSVERIPIIEEKILVANHRIADLEEIHKSRKDV